MPKAPSHSGAPKPSSLQNGEDEKVVIHDGGLAATSYTDEMVKKVEDQMRAVLKNPGLIRFIAVSYRTDFLIGKAKITKGRTSYFVKVSHLFSKLRK